MAADGGAIGTGGCGTIPACCGAMIVGCVGAAVCIGLKSGIPGETIFFFEKKKQIFAKNSINWYEIGFVFFFK